MVRQMSEIEDEVCRKIQERAVMGDQKYSTTMEREDLLPIDWLIHAQQEAMDLAIYLERIINDERKAMVERVEIRNLLEEFKSLYEDNIRPLVDGMDVVDMPFPEGNVGHKKGDEEE